MSLPESDLVAESLAFEQPISMTENQTAAAVAQEMNKARRDSDIHDNQDG